MNKKETIREIRDVVEGNSVYDFIAVAKKEKGRGYKIVGSGLGYPVSENYNARDMMFRHSMNECTLAEAEELLKVKMRKVEMKK